MQPARWHAVACLLVMALLGTSGVAAAPNPSEVIARVQEAGGEVQKDPQGTAEDPRPVIEVLLDPESPPEEQPAAPVDDAEPGFADRVRDAFQDEVLVAGMATMAASALGLVGFALVTRYVSPKEALKNPQRAMLYGFVRGNPGVHLKKLSEEFAMKTSSILWHIRKLESAELVRSERANGFRVFYPVEGGIEMKRVSRAITALQNPNARILFETLERRGGVSPQQLAARLSIHAGTVRWHLRKLRDFGLVEELVRDDGSQVFATPLGRKALQTLVGVPVEMPRPLTSPLPVLVE
jgi:DNA-binding transcriptional ArsR family regulator